MSTEQWTQVSRTIDFIMAQPTGGAQAVKGEPEKPKRRKPTRPKPQPPMEQQRMF